mgnify:CR=1 FL=1|jgi:L-seryl-tRNA(Ser) seleniumtransferase
MKANLRQLPSVDHILTCAREEGWLEFFGRPMVLHAVRNLLEDLRNDPPGQLPETSDLLITLHQQLLADVKPVLGKVINATGVILHTNLGRAPLSKQAAQAAETIAGEYSNMELNLVNGKRGSRSDLVNQQLISLTGCQASLVVNNNAGAVLLALSALAKGKKAAISRSQLVEIGGGFRVPDVMRQSGARLIEIGTTNRTHLRDYTQAVEEGASLILIAHPSNFRLVGFTAEPSLEEICHLARGKNIPVIFDLGSGALLDTAQFGLAHEPTVQEALQAGCNLVCFSGDKLLGGPQAGIMVGDVALTAKIERHPLYRALRPDKLLLASLSATLLHYQKDEVVEQIPIYQMLSRSLDSLERQAAYLQSALGCGELVSGESTVGGGSLPGETLPTCLLRLDSEQPQQLLSRLRQQTPPIIARITDDRVVIDPRTILPDEEMFLIRGIQLSLIECEGLHEKRY